MELKPLGDRILIKRLDPATKTPGGLFIPDTSKEKPQQAKVLAVGPGKTLEDGKVVPLGVKAGDDILISKYGGNEVNIDGVECLICREDDILGIVEE